ncbi:MAG: hypothetical protein OXH20_09205 [bacterium]|nr:hypothetical protein [bacterium]MYB25132.1 hypothetical protein [Acidimicrobiia bacterium]MYE67013.1 hypothetical protein [Acidimicrobiia bacterium]
MYVVLDLRTGQRRLVEADDFDRFHIEADGDRHDVLAVLGAEARLGRTHHLWWSVEAVRRLAEADRVPAWDAQFEDMMAQAAKHGWIDDAGTHVQVHIERPGGGIVTTR